MILEPTEENIALAARTLRAGGLIAFPTETVYGLAADVFQPAAVKKIFEIKGRARSNPLIVHVASFEQISSVAVLGSNELRARLGRLRIFCPGPLTVVLPARAEVPPEVTASGSTVAVRIPAHPVAQRLLAVCATPLAAPSANRSTHVSPTTALHVQAEFERVIGCILDGGPSVIGIESTVLDLTTPSPTVLRPGAVTIEALTEALQETVVLRGEVAEGEQPRSPGSEALHYAPRTRTEFLDLYEWKRDTQQRIGVILFSSAEIPSTVQERAVSVRVLSPSGSLKEAAANLYAALREMDALEIDLILIERCVEDGIGIAVMDRLRRATAARKRGEHKRR